MSGPSLQIEQNGDPALELCGTWSIMKQVPTMVEFSSSAFPNSAFDRLNVRFYWPLVIFLTLVHAKHVKLSVHVEVRKSEVALFSEDEIIGLGATCTWMCVLAGLHDLTSWMEEDEGGKQSSVWDIVSTLVERGRLGYKEDERKARSLLEARNAAVDSDKFRKTLREQRDSLLERLVEYAIGTQSSTAEGVKRAVFQILMNLYILFCPTRPVTEDGQWLPTEILALQLDDEVQYRCAGFIQATIEQYAELLEDDRPSEESTERDDSSDSQEDVRAVKNVRGKGPSKTQSKTPAERNQPTSRVSLEQEYQFVVTVSPFLRAIRAGAVHVRHGAVLLAHYGRLGPVFDICTKVIVDVLREECMYNDNGEVVVDIVTQALKEMKRYGQNLECPLQASTRAGNIFVKLKDTVNSGVMPSTVATTRKHDPLSFNFPTWSNP
ncbi:hypothetical protein EV401DRAFT_1893265 [Pisolithus croceorrhizus]|nr:hypothetical protein EV401DRAFT_1893265 [Pisolithus croceorrhizus]